ncbi:MAG: hypothetical protein ACI906_000448 [Candidatus Latescibacterota bacterium]|jgi:hypothetical protein
MWKRMSWAVLLLVVLGAFAWASERNIAPDALTRATQGYNQYEGELGWLSDGVYPDNSTEASAFIWPNKGNLVFQFEVPYTVLGLRLRVGADAGLYQVWAYRNAEYGEDGQTAGANMEVLADAVNNKFAENTWVDLLFERAIETDYIELSTSQGAEFFEVEILGAEQTAVQQMSWADIKTHTGLSAERR